MTLTTFKCERCHGFKKEVARRKGLLEHSLLPLLLIRPYRCGECSDRYQTFGIGSNRIVFRQRTAHLIRLATIVILCASAVGAAVVFLMWR